MKWVLKSFLSRRCQERLVQSRLFFLLQRWAILLFGRKPSKSETSKARQRRLSEGFFDNYCQGRGLDIGYGGDLVCSNAIGWDIEDGDAVSLKNIPGNSFDFVYSSHTLEHMTDPDTAIKNWWRVLKYGGFLILYVPHRDLYEKRKSLPSLWNLDHKHFFLPEDDEPPVTIGLLPLLESAISPFELIYIKVCSDGHTITDPRVHSNGEYSIEAVLLKPPQ